MSEVISKSQAGPGEGMMPSAFDVVKELGCSLPNVEATTRYDGTPVLKAPIRSVQARLRRADLTVLSNSVHANHSRPVTTRTASSRRRLTAFFVEARYTPRMSRSSPIGKCCLRGSRWPGGTDQCAPSKPLRLASSGARDGTDLPKEFVLFVRQALRFGLQSRESCQNSSDAKDWKGMQAARQRFCGRPSSKERNCRRERPPSSPLEERRRHHRERNPVRSRRPIPPGRARRVKRSALPAAP
jgi:hypothetical protein